MRKKFYSFKPGDKVTIDSKWFGSKNINLEAYGIFKHYIHTSGYCIVDWVINPEFKVFEEDYNIEINPIKRAGLRFAWGSPAWQHVKEVFKNA